MDLEKFTNLLETLPHSGMLEIPPPTFLEIAGYPQLENVASNILGFFFDSRGDHQLKSIFLQALLETAGLASSSEDLQVESVHREVSTDARTRLDLVISTPTLLVGIENKFFHELNNDLLTYKEYLHSKAGGRKQVGILLSLETIPPSIHRDVFIPVTYSAFFENIRRNIGQVVVGANQSYLPLLFDFIKSVEHLAQEPTMPDPAYRTWVNEHQKEISILFRDIDQFKKQMLRTIKKLQARIDLSKYEHSGVMIKPWLYDAGEESQFAQILVYDVELPDGLTFGIDVILSPVDWKITVLGREPATIQAYEKFFKKMTGFSYQKFPMVADTFEKRLLVGEKYNYDVDMAILAEKIQDLIDRIVAQAVSQAMDAV